VPLSALPEEPLPVLLLLVVVVVAPAGPTCSLYGSLGLFAACAHSLQLLLLKALPTVKAVTDTRRNAPSSRAHADPADRW
jgi:hypothetical protein